jgi:carbon-monoxide dehydrogenase medium subunit
VKGHTPDVQAFRLAAEAAANAIEPLEDHLTTGEYRRDLVRAVTERALQRTLGID